MGPKSNVPAIETETGEEERREEGHMKMEAEIGVMLP